MSIDMNAEIDIDAVEDFVWSFIKHNEAHIEQLKEERERSRPPSFYQHIKISFTDQFVKAMEEFFNSTTDARYLDNFNNQTKDIPLLRKMASISLMEVYTSHLLNKFSEFHFSARSLVTYVTGAFGGLRQEMGDANNTSIRYLEEALGQFLTEDEDFLTTYLRALQLINRDHLEIDVFSWIEGAYLKQDKTPLFYSDWVETVYDPFIDESTSKD